MEGATGSSILEEPEANVLKEKIDNLGELEKRFEIGRGFSSAEKRGWWQREKKRTIGLIRNKQLDTLITIFTEVFDFSKRHTPAVPQGANSEELKQEVLEAGFNISDKTEERMLEKAPETFKTASDFERMYLGWVSEEYSNETEQKFVLNTQKSLFRFVFGTKTIKEITNFPKYYSRLRIAYTQLGPQEKTPCKKGTTQGAGQLWEDFQRALEYRRENAILEMAALRARQTEFNYEVQLKKRLVLGLTSMLELLEDGQRPCFKFGKDDKAGEEEELEEEDRAKERRGELTDEDYDRILKVFARFVRDRKDIQNTHTLEKLRANMKNPEVLEEDETAQTLYEQLLEMLTWTAKVEDLVKYKRLLTVITGEAEFYRNLVLSLIVVLEGTGRIQRIMNQIKDVRIQLAHCCGTAAGVRAARAQAQAPAAVDDAAAQAAADAAAEVARLRAELARANQLLQTALANPARPAAAPQEDPRIAQLQAQIQRLQTQLGQAQQAAAAAAAQAAAAPAPAAPAPAPAPAPAQPQQDQQRAALEAELARLEAELAQTRQDLSQARQTSQQFQSYANREIRDLQAIIIRLSDIITATHDVNEIRQTMAGLRQAIADCARRQEEIRALLQRTQQLQQEGSDEYRTLYEQTQAVLLQKDEQIRTLLHMNAELLDVIQTYKFLTELQESQRKFETKLRDVKQRLRDCCYWREEYEGLLARLQELENESQLKTETEGELHTRIRQLDQQIQQLRTEVGEARHDREEELREAQEASARAGAEARAAEARAAEAAAQAEAAVAGSAEQTEAYRRAAVAGIEAAAEEAQRLVNEAGAKFLEARAEVDRLRQERSDFASARENAVLAQAEATLRIAKMTDDHMRAIEQEAAARAALVRAGMEDRGRIRELERALEEASEAVESQERKYQRLEQMYSELRNTSASKLSAANVKAQLDARNALLEEQTRQLERREEELERVREALAQAQERAPQAPEPALAQPEAEAEAEAPAEAQSLALAEAQAAAAVLEEEGNLAKLESLTLRIQMLSAITRGELENLQLNPPPNWRPVLEGLLEDFNQQLNEIEEEAGDLDLGQLPATARDAVEAAAAEVRAALEALAPAAASAAAAAGQPAANPIRQLATILEVPEENENNVESTAATAGTSKPEPLPSLIDEEGFLINRQLTAELLTYKRQRRSSETAKATKAGKALLRIFERQAQHPEEFEKPFHPIMQEAYDYITTPTPKPKSKPGYLGGGGKANTKGPRKSTQSLCQSMLSLLLLDARRNNKDFDAQEFLDKAGATLDDLGQCPLVLHVLNELLDDVTASSMSKSPQMPEGYTFHPQPNLLSHVPALKVLEDAFHARFEPEEKITFELMAAPVQFFTEVPDEYEAVLGQQPYILHRNMKHDEEISPLFGAEGDLTEEPIQMTREERKALENPQRGLPMGALLFLYLLALRDVLDGQTREESRCQRQELKPKKTVERAKTPKRKRASP